MYGALRGNVLAFALFAAAFALHIVGGATDQGWLFATAVVLIAAVAVGFPWFAATLSRAQAPASRRLATVLGTLIGIALTASALWAANDRAWAWWHFPVAAVVVTAVAAFTLRGASPGLRRRRGSPAPG